MKTNDRIWLVEFQFYIGETRTAHVFQVKATTRVKANLIGWREFNLSYPLYFGGVWVQTD